MDVNDLLRQIAVDPDMINTLSEPETDAVLTRLGVNIKTIQDRFIKGPVDTRYEMVIRFLTEHPHLISTLPSDVMKMLLDYIGANSDPATVRDAFRKAGAG